MKIINYIARWFVPKLLMFMLDVRELVFLEKRPSLGRWSKRARLSEIWSKMVFIPFSGLPQRNSFLRARKLLTIISHI